MGSDVLTVRVDSSIAKRLARLAEATKRSRSFLAAEAIEEYLTTQEWQVAAIEQGLAEADRGEGVALETVRKAWEKRRGGSSHR